MRQTPINGLCLLVATVIGLAACGGGSTGNSGANAGATTPTPKITSVSPFASFGTGTITVEGTDLPSTVQLSVSGTDISCKAPAEVKATGFSVSCTVPTTITGVRTVTISTNTAALGGTTIDATHSIRFLGVTKVTPETMAPGVATTFTVSGGNFPATVQMTMKGGTCASPSGVTADTSATSFEVACTPDASTYGRISTAVLSDTNANKGVVIGSGDVYVSPYQLVKKQSSGTYAASDCVQDHNTGLIWEVKTKGSTRPYDAKYTNLISGSRISTSTTTTAGTSEVDASTNAAGYINTVNTAALCGITNWRLPTKAELLTLINLKLSPPIDSFWFPSTQTESNQPWYWASTSSSNDATDLADYVSFYNGDVGTTEPRLNPHYVRLVYKPNP